MHRDKQKWLQTQRQMYILIHFVCKHIHTRTHTQYTRGVGDLIKCRQWLCGLAYSGAGPPSCHSNSSSRPIRCCIKARAAIKRWVHRRHCCVRGQQSATSPAGICRRWSRRESHLTTASTAEAGLPAVWSSPNVHVTEPQASGMEVMRRWKKYISEPPLSFLVIGPLSIRICVCLMLTVPKCDANKLKIKVTTFFFVLQAIIQSCWVAAGFTHCSTSCLPGSRARHQVITFLVWRFTFLFFWFSSPNLHGEFFHWLNEQIS